jgi:hypothetical protein
MKRTIAVVLMMVILLTSPAAFAISGDRDANNMIADTLLLRPIGVAALAVGTVLYIVSLPAALMTDSQKDTYKVLVKEPSDYVFKRPVGEIGSGL